MELALVSSTKKDGTYRPVTDFQKLNAVTDGETFPLPVLSDLLMNLGEGNKFFSSLDLLSGYWPLWTLSPESTQRFRRQTGISSGSACPLV